MEWSDTWEWKGKTFIKCKSCGKSMPVEYKDKHKCEGQAPEPQPAKSQPALKPAQPTDIRELIKVLTMPKLTVSVEKTVQETQFEPKKVSAFITIHPLNVTPEKISELLDMVEKEVLAKAEARPRIKQTENELNKKYEGAIRSSEESLVEKAMGG